MEGQPPGARRAWATAAEGGMIPAPGTQVYPPGRPEVDAYVSTVVAGMLAVISDRGYHIVRPDEVVVVGPHPREWDRHAQARARCGRWTR